MCHSRYAAADYVELLYQWRTVIRYADNDGSVLCVCASQELCAAREHIHVPFTGVAEPSASFFLLHDYRKRRRECRHTRVLCRVCQHLSRCTAGGAAGFFFVFFIISCVGGSEE